MDSYMYQTVGHDAIELYSEAMGLPLFRRTIQGSPVEQGKEYSINEKDEVEDLYELLKDVMVGIMGCSRKDPHSGPHTEEISAIRGWGGMYF